MLLANRIALLKQEELRTWKKIEETKKRADDVQKLKQRNQNKILEVIKLHMTFLENSYDGWAGSATEADATGEL